MRFLRSSPLLRTDHAGRPPLLAQLVLIGVFLGFYDAVRRLAPGRQGLARSNAHRLLDLERALGLDWERPLNQWLARHETLGYLGGTLYDSLHYLVTLPLLALVYAWAPQHYRRLRDVLIACNAIGLLVFWLVPLAPPRLTDPGVYPDVVARTGALGGWARTITSTADQYAAMPSLHIAWAVWVALTVVAITDNRVLRALAVAYPIVTTMIIMATGNHWLLDAAAGGATLAVSVGLVNAFTRERVRPRELAVARSL